MENPSEKVYECTLAVEARMICDLLARAGISARVDNDGGGGEMTCFHAGQSVSRVEFDRFDMPK